MDDFTQFHIGAIVRILSLLGFVYINVAVGPQYFGVSLIALAIIWVASLFITAHDLSRREEQEDKERQKREEAFKAVFGNYTIQEQARRKREQKKE